MSLWWEKLAGQICSCPSGCTDRVWGDAGTCDPNCRPCQIMRGQPYQPHPNRKK